MGLWRDDFMNFVKKRIFVLVISLCNNQINVTMNYRVNVLVIILSFCCLMGCDRMQSGNTDDNALVVEPAGKTYPIGSVFVGGGIADPSEGSSHRCHFYQEKFEEGPLWNEVEALIEIYGFRHSGVEYSEAGQYVNQIIINGLDESLGLGSVLDIPMDQGMYEGGNDLIEGVQIISYKFASYIGTEENQNKDADINIVITTVSGSTITIRFANDVTPYDGYV